MDKPYSDPDITKLVDKVAMAIGKMAFAANTTPEYEFDDEKLKFVWSDGTRSEVKNIDLRADCGCAVCVDEYSGEKLLKVEDLPKDIKPTEITPLGNYALKITWSDGHSSGIYPYRQIRKLETVL